MLNSKVVIPYRVSPCLLVLMPYFIQLSTWLLRATISLLLELCVSGINESNEGVLHLVSHNLCDYCYLVADGGTFTMFNDLLPKFGIDVRFFDAEDPHNFVRTMDK